VQKGVPVARIHIQWLYEALRVGVCLGRVAKGGVWFCDAETVVAQRKIRQMCTVK
jgi:hypothetical protein